MNRRTLSLLTLLLATALPATAGNWITGTYSNSSGSRNYELYIPDGYVAGERIPLLVGLHGCTETPSQFAGLTRIAALADANHLLVLQPEQSAVDNSILCWNWFLTEHQKRGEGEPSIIKGMVDWTKEHYSVDNARVFVFGLSAGAFMTSTMLACYSDVFAAGVIAEGGMYEAGSDLASGVNAQSNGSAKDPNIAGLDAWRCSGSVQPRAVPVLVFHGTSDATVVPANGQQAIDQFAQTNDYGDDGVDNASLVNVPTKTMTAVAPGGLNYTLKEYGSLMQFYLIEGMSHRWSGGDPLFVYGEPKGPDATAIMWDFFRLHPRSISLASVQPESLCQGGPETTVFVTGANFTSASVVQLNGANRPTQLVDATTLRVTLLSADRAAAGTATIRAFDNTLSNAISLAIVADTTPPRVTAPAAVEVMQSTCSGGATPATSPALAAFLAAATAQDECTAAPIALAVAPDTPFEAGTHDTTFRFRDNAGNIGAASTTLTVRLWGDFDRDDAVGATDIVVFANYLVGNLSPDLGAGDLNGDGAVDAIDFVIASNFLVGNIDCLVR